MRARADILATARLRQPIEELRRKQRKAAQRGIWTQEDMDLADREAHELWLDLHGLRATGA